VYTGRDSAEAGSRAGVAAADAWTQNRAAHCGVQLGQHGHLVCQLWQPACLEPVYLIHCIQSLSCCSSSV